MKKYKKKRELEISWRGGEPREPFQIKNRLPRRSWVPVDPSTSLEK